MESKSPTYNEDHPPPYSPPGPEVSTFNPSSLTSHLQHHLTSIPERLRQSQQARDAQQVAHDTELLDHLVPIVEEFLAGIGDQPLATLFLVPDAAVPENAQLSGLDDMRRRGEAVRVSKVTAASSSKQGSSATGSSTQSNESSWTPGREFSDWGRWDDAHPPGMGTSDNAGGYAASKMIWWRDERTARRLAAYLQPQKKPKRVREPPVDLQTPVQAVVEQSIPATKGKRSLGWGWGKRRSDIPISSTPPMPQPSSAYPNEKGPPKDTEAEQNDDDGGDEDDDKVGMTVTAQEVAFRSENAFGIWESTSGWAIVVVVTVRRPASMA